MASDIDRLCDSLTILCSGMIQRAQTRLGERTQADDECAAELGKAAANIVWTLNEVRRAGDFES